MNYSRVQVSNFRFLLISPSAGDAKVGLWRCVCFAGGGVTEFLDFLMLDR